MKLNDHPVSKSWHPFKNVLSIDDLTVRSGRKAWWQCEKGHEWECRIADRVQTKGGKGTGCPVCAGRRTLIGFNDLATSHPEIASEWHFRNSFSAQEVTAGSSKKVWWLGTACGHEWQTTVVARTSGSGCLYCAGYKVLAGFNDLATSNPEVARKWHPTKNGSLFPTMVAPKAQKIVWWLDDCGHEYEDSVNSRNRPTSGCPVCDGRRLLQGYNDLASQYPLVASSWHPSRNGSLMPEMIHMTTHRKVWWLCDKGHEWRTAVFTRSKDKSGCPTCFGLIVARGFNDLASQYPAVAATWHPTKNGPLTPEEVYAGGAKSYWWQCDKGHEWKAQMQARVYGGTGCPTCVANSYVSKAEQEISDYLSNHEFEVEQSHRKLFKNQRELDIYIPSHHTAIEYNGLYYHTEKMGKDEAYHREKWLACREKGVTLVQIWEDYWLENPDKVKSLILKILGKREPLDLSSPVFRLCKAGESREFLRASSPYSQEAGTSNIKILVGSHEAVLSFSIQGTECLIAGYGDNLAFYSGELLGLLLEEVAAQHEVTECSVLVDNCSPEFRVFEMCGFVADSEEAPRPWAMQRDRRFPVTIEGKDYLYTGKDGVERHVQKEKLIWDAGRTLWKRK